MANTNSTIVTAHATAQTSGQKPVDPLDAGAMPIFIRGRITCPAEPDAEDTLTLVPGNLIPDGAAYAPELSWFFPVTNPGTLLTLDVGPKSDGDGLADALDLTTAATRVGFDASATVPKALSQRVKHVAGEDITAEVMVSTAVAATVIEFCIAYYVNA